MPSLNIIFAGTPEFAARHFKALLLSEHHIVAAYTQPDRPAGRGKKMSASPVKALAQAHNIAIMQPLNLKTEAAQSELAAFDCDIMVVVAYGLLLPKAVLETPRLGCINVHGSILPRWRGAAPIQRAIEAGDSVSGVTIMQMDVGLDTGDMLVKRECQIAPDETSATLHDKLCEIGPPALIEALKQLANSSAAPEQQDDSKSSYACKIDKIEALIDWGESAELLDRKIRAFNPFPICYTMFNGERLRIHSARVIRNDGDARESGVLSVDGNSLLVQCGQGELSIETLQLPGKKTMTASAFINGFGDLLPRPGESVQLGEP